MPDKKPKTRAVCLDMWTSVTYVVFLSNVQAGYNPLMLAVANDIEIIDYQDMLCHLIDKTGVNLTAEKVIP